MENSYKFLISFTPPPPPLSPLRSGHRGDRQGCLFRGRCGIYTAECAFCRNRLLFAGPCGA